MSATPYAGLIQGTDVMMLHFESPSAAFHTLKLAVLDTSARGRPVTLDEIAAVAPTYLGISPRLTQRVEKRPRRFHWVDDESFDVRNHLEERTVTGEDGLDRLCGELAGEHLDRGRPLWKLCLVHGLPGGRQAAVVRVHHAIMDGTAAMNAFRALTSPTQGTPPAVPVRTLPDTGHRPSLPRRLVNVGALTLRQRKKTKEYAPDETVPRTSLPRTVLNPRQDIPGRACASRSVAVADLSELAGLLGTNPMGALHAVVGHTVHAYLVERNALPDHRMVANFGVVVDKNDDRCDGNHLATARIWLPLDLDDPLERARLTALSCKESVALRRHRGFELQRDAAEFARIVPELRNRFVNLTPSTPVHMQTAYVVGPTEDRWFGDVAAVGWTSFAISVAPADFSITAYSYAGRMWLGVVVTPGAMPDPAHFLDLFERSLDDLLVMGREALG